MSATERDSLHPATWTWLLQQRGPPTAVQREAWPHIGAGAHVLAVAPTGSGKTLAACLPALDALLTGRWPPLGLSVVYVSPLKALGADIQRNLTEPLAGLSARLRQAGVAPPRVRVQLRTGDTPSRERVQMAKDPPQILVTTPESLHLLLMSKSGRAMLQTARYLVLDEIHAVARTPRGALLMAAVEELEDLVAAPLQRVALSATLRDPEQAAREVLGSERPRASLQLVAPVTEKHLNLQCLTVPLGEGAAGEPGWWPQATRVLRQELASARTALIFGSGRRSVERLARELNDGEPEPLAWAHHGSLAHALRRTVEQRLKDGELRAVCATSSLELGIDVGAVDRVVMVGAPWSVSSTLQRLGRAGHAVGATSVGSLLPLPGRDLLRCAVLPNLVARGQLEALPTQTPPLDVLAQVILARCVAMPRRAQELFDQVRRAAPFAALTRAAFDDVIAMLTGRWQGLRVRELQPRLAHGHTGELTALPGGRMVAVRSSGVIADRGYFAVTVQGEGTPLGELDEEFVWERRTGDVFAIGAQAWQVASIGRDRVEVIPARRRVAIAPFWRADSRDRSATVADAVLRLCQDLEPDVENPKAIEHLVTQGASPQLANEVCALLARQVAATGRLPGLHCAVWELCQAPGEPTGHAILHLGWGGAQTRPLALALGAYLAAQTGRPISPAVSDDAILFVTHDDLDVPGLFADFLRETWLDWVAQGLERSDLLGARFREALGTALVLPRPPPGRRTPLWQTRERAKELLAAVAQSPGFPLLAHARHTIMRDRFDLPGLVGRLQQLADGTIALHVAHTQRPSPLSDGVVFLATGALIYEDDRPREPGSRETLRDIALSPTARPTLDGTILAEWTARWLRTAAAHAAEDAADLLDAVAQAAPVMTVELQAMVAAAAARQGRTPAEVHLQVEASLCDLGQQTWCTQADVQGLRALQDDARRGAALVRWLGPRGAVTWQQVQAAWQLDAPTARRLLADAIARGEVADGVQRDDMSGDFLCLARTVERLLAAMRGQRKRQATQGDASDVLLLRALLSGLLLPQTGPPAVTRILHLLQGLPLPPGLWESDILPARIAQFRPADLDRALSDGQWRWYGQGSDAAPLLGWSVAGALELWTDSAAGPGDWTRWMPDSEAGYSYEVLRARSGLDDSALSARLWADVWRGQLVGCDMHGVRRGLQLGFAWPSGSLRSRTSWRNRATQGGSPWPGPWQRRDLAGDGDAVQQAEMAAERARQLVSRWGLLGPGLLETEAAALRWPAIRAAARRMDWSGELLAGAWFAGLGGWQLLAPGAERRLGELAQFRQTLWWCHCLDPASPCGMPDACLGGQALPTRNIGTWLVMGGAQVVAVGRREGKSLELRVAPDHARAEAILGHLLARFRRAGGPKLRVEDIDGEPAYKSRWRPLLLQQGLTADFRDLVL